MASVWETRGRRVPEPSRPLAGPHGPEPLWSGCCTGPAVLTEAELEQLARDLLGVSLSAVPALAAAELRSYVEAPGVRPPSVLLHSATPTTRGFEGDLAALREGRPPNDAAAYMETRVVALGRPGDLAVGRTPPWREAVLRSGLACADVGDLAHYYLSHALLVAARRHGTEPVGALTLLVEWLRARPDSVVRLYTLDLETQLLLVWLKRQAGLETVRVDANDPVVSAHWNSKTHIHPSVEDAEALEPVGRVDELLAEEQRASSAYRRLGMEIPVLPGYLIARGDDPEAFALRALGAARLLRDRYGIRFGCFKPCEAADGARIVPRVDLSDDAELLRCVREAFPYGDDYLLEAHVAFHRFHVRDRAFELVPSGHVRNGRVVDGLTAQLMDGCSWGGNVFFDAVSCGDLGIGDAHHALMVSAMHAVRDAFHGERSVAEGCHGGLVTGGVDFAVGRIGGRFGQRTVVGVIDFNLSSHGAEYMRDFQEEVTESGSAAYAATRVYRPSPRATLAATDAAVADLAGCGGPVRTVCCVPGRWGMVAATGSTPRGAAGAAFDLVAGLADRGLAEPGR